MDTLPLIDKRLHVVAVISNPVPYIKRYFLFRQFMERMEKDKNVILYVVELAYQQQDFIITSQTNPRHLQLRTETPLWHKENMINLAVSKLLPSDYNAFAWIDGDVEFENHNWALDALESLSGSNDVIQLFSHCIDLDQCNRTSSIVSSAGYQYGKGNRMYSTNNALDYWHPGYAWAITRNAYEKIGGLFDKAIIGSGDTIILSSILEISDKIVDDKYNNAYKKAVSDYATKIKGTSAIRFGYIPGLIRHYFHGSKKNRKYTERRQILFKHGYEPSFVGYDENGVLIPTSLFPDDLKTDIMNYFLERNEDEYFC
uniref:Glycosyltransferase n=1 Tax=viral metagenome TaxID=1070528 RepID=A0A6C0KF86_9ZZZZ